MTSEPALYGTAGMIKTVLGCTNAEALTVRAVLAGVMQHRQTRAFLKMTLHMSNTTRTVKATRDDVLINEGKRQVGLFLEACAGTALEFDPENTQDAAAAASFRATYRNPTGEQE